MQHSLVACPVLFFCLQAWASEAPVVDDCNATTPQRLGVLIQRIDNDARHSGSTPTIMTARRC